MSKMNKVGFILKRNKRDTGTQIYKVIAKRGNKHLGIVKWSIAYREYAYFPQNDWNKGLNLSLLEPLVKFIKRLTEDYKEWKKENG